MPETPEPIPTPVPDIQERLHDVAGLLRQSSTLDPAAQRALAELVDELSKALEAASVPSAEVTHLAESTARLAEYLHEREDRDLLDKARHGLESAVINAEAHAPLAVGLARRLLDTLANMGI